MDKGSMLEKKPIYYCSLCQYSTQHKGMWKRHYLTQKHAKNILKKKELKNTTIAKEKKYFCDKCNYHTSHHGAWQRHLNTLKHKYQSDELYLSTGENNYQFVCECGKEYKYKSGLNKHQINCTAVISETNTAEKELVKTLISSNKELQEMLKEQIQHTTELMKKQESLSTTSNCITHNTMNNQFNINFFLNEQCKNALNLTDFINSLQLHLEDLKNTNRLGFAEGISNAFIRGLKELDMYKRPIHCSDIKRTIMYVKDDDQWLKEDNEKETLKRGIKEIGHVKFIKLIKEWEQNNPDWAITDQGTVEYTKMVQNVTRDLGENTENKIIKNIAKEVLIDKNI